MLNIKAILKCKHIKANNAKYEIHRTVILKHGHEIVLTSTHYSTETQYYK